MAARIEHHRQGRPAHWRTVERWQHLDELIHADINPHEAVLLECVTTMVTNLLFDYGGDKDLMNGIIRRWNRRLMLRFSR